MSFKKMSLKERMGLYRIAEDANELDRFMNKRKWDVARQVLAMALATGLRLSDKRCPITRGEFEEGLDFMIKLGAAYQDKEGSFIERANASVHAASEN